jgi:small-conductance mechanosensitive channel
MQRLLELKAWWSAPLDIFGLQTSPSALTGGLLVLVAFWVVGSFVRKRVERTAQNREPARRAALYTVSRLVLYVMIGFGLMAAMSTAGIPVSRFAVLAGAVGVGLGFGLQSIFNNFVSGLILLFDRSLKVGDFVELESGVHGEVTDISIRATRITTNDNIDILVPNSEFVSGRVVNWTHRDVSRRIRVPFGVAYGSDKDKVRAAVLEAAQAVPFTLTGNDARKPQVWLVNFGDSSLDFELVVWLTAEATKRPSAVRAAYLWEIESALARVGLEIPFPQRDLHLRSLFGLERADALAAMRGEDVGHVHTRREDAPMQIRENADNDAAAEVKRELEEDARRAAGQYDIPASDALESSDSSARHDKHADQNG